MSPMVGNKLGNDSLNSDIDLTLLIKFWKEAIIKTSLIPTFVQILRSMMSELFKQQIQNT
jgi:hypothetical protein